MKMRTCCCAFALLLLSVPTYADSITFSSRAAFNAAAPGLPVETFESGLVAAGSSTSCNGPLSSASASPCFPAGGLLPGATYSAVPGLSNPNMILFGAGILGATSKVLGPNFFADTLDITFTAPVTAVGLDAYGFSGIFAISVFSSAGASLGNFTILSNVEPTFFGFLSTTDLIGRINVSSGGELVDNMAFGTPVPEPSSLLLVAGVLAILLPLSYVRKRRTHPR